MKIVQLTPYFPPHTGGTEKYVKDLSISLAKRGHEVTVITCNVPRRAHAPQQEVIEGVKIIRLPAIDTAYLPVTLNFNLKMLEGFDIVHIHAPAFGFVRSVAGKVKMPVVVMYHCDVTMFDKLYGIPVPEWIIKAVEEFSNRTALRLLPKADAVLCTTEAYAKASPVLSKIPHQAVPIGIHFKRIDEVRSKLGIAEESRKKNQILFVGRLASSKGVNYLIEAFAKVLRAIPEAELVIAGEGEEKAYLLSLIKKLGVEKAITFYGTVTFELLVSLYTTSTVFVLPSTNKLEAFGIVQLEAMACFTPVVCTDIPGPNVVMETGKSGLLVPPKNSEALAQTLIQILSNPSKAKEMGRRGRELVETKYNWGVIAGQIEEIYRGLI